jgi:hypothetical protein
VNYDSLTSTRTTLHIVLFTHTAFAYFSVEHTCLLEGRQSLILFCGLCNLGFSYQTHRFIHDMTMFPGVLQCRVWARLPSGSPPGPSLTVIRIPKVWDFGYEIRGRQLLCIFVLSLPSQCTERRQTRQQDGDERSSTVSSERTRLKTMPSSSSPFRRC